jgi:hypothetical protein
MQLPRPFAWGYRYDMAKAVIKTAIPTLAETAAEYRIPAKDLKHDLDWLSAAAQGSTAPPTGGKPSRGVGEVNGIVITVPKDATLTNLNLHNILNADWHDIVGGGSQKRHADTTHKVSGDRVITVPKDAKLGDTDWHNIVTAGLQKSNPAVSLKVSGDHIVITVPKDVKPKDSNWYNLVNAGLDKSDPPVGLKSSGDRVVITVPAHAKTKESNWSRFVDADLGSAVAGKSSGGHGDRIIIKVTKVTHKPDLRKILGAAGLDKLASAEPGNREPAGLNVMRVNTVRLYGPQAPLSRSTRRTSRRRAIAKK